MFLYRHISKKTSSIIILLILFFYSSNNSASTPSETSSEPHSVNYKVTEQTIIKALDGKVGDAYSGRLLTANVKKGNCLACHHLPIPEELLHGNLGPSLVHIGDQLNAAQLRLRIVDMQAINPFTIMPSFYKSTDTLTRIAEKYEHTTILSAQEIEHIIAYLLTLKSTSVDH